MNGEEVFFRKEGKVAYITINREKALNALNSNVMTRLEQIISELEHEDEILVLVITGAGKKSFVAGADINEIKEAGSKRTELIKKGQEILSKIRNSNRVIIAAVNGYALGGGCELAMACDIRIASEIARFGFPEAKLGLMAGYGGTQLLPRLIGTGRAKYLMFTGEMLTAAQAYEFGLVEKVCSPESLTEEVERIARVIASNGPSAIQAYKRAINLGKELPLDHALKLELEEYDKVSCSADAEEGILAFLQKRTPTFKGKRLLNFVK